MQTFQYPYYAYIQHKSTDTNFELPQIVQTVQKEPTDVGIKY